MPRRAVSTKAGTITSPTAASPKAATPKRGRKRKDETDPTAQVEIPRDETQTQAQQDQQHEQEHEHEEADKENQPATATTPRGRGRGRGKGKGKGKGRSPRGAPAKRAKTETQEEQEEQEEETPPEQPNKQTSTRATNTNEQQDEEIKDIPEEKVKTAGKSDEIKLPAGTRTAILEKGRIYFFYRPKVDSGDHVRDFSDIQRLYVLLSPIESEPCDSEEHQQETPTGNVDVPPPAKQEGPVTHRLTQHLSANFPHRLIIIPTKKLPVGGRPIFAFVDRVSYSMDDIEENLDPIDYVTKTRGARHTGSARPAGEGIYELIKLAHPAKPGHAAPRPHVELVYTLEVPEPKHMGMAQQVLNIQQDGHMVLQVKNPLIMTSTGRTDTTVPRVSHAGHPMPHHLQQLFTGKKVAQTRFIPCDPPEFLNVERLELLLLGGKKDVHDLGAIADELIEEAQREAEQESQAHHGHPEQRVMEEVHLSPKVHPTESLTSGKLV